MLNVNIMISPTENSVWWFKNSFFIIMMLYLVDIIQMC